MDWKDKITLLLFGILSLSKLVISNMYAKQLYEDLLRKKGYNSFVRPVMNDSDVITVKIGIRLTQIIDVVRKI